ncbi:Uncharacterised protein [Chromobacterium violaceum]|uniref:Uncharacterized protein n=1 Tax=Chromobacterium violaceum TaxID=536 RepID=A0A447T4B5_CHRVL|nr:Uncharacterised protein [Chromobacterium violaceum]
MSASSLRVLSLIPPMTQLNTPYPSTAYLTGFLRSRGVAAFQEDLALALVLRLFSKAGLATLREHVQRIPMRQRTDCMMQFDISYERYAATVDAVIGFLQGRDATLSYRIAGRNYLPEGRASRRWTCTWIRTTRTAATRWPGPSARWAPRTEPATWPRCT